MPWNLYQQARAALRTLWMKSPMRAQAIREARTTRGWYLCNHCGKEGKLKEMQVHHLEPVGMDKPDWNLYIDRLFCDSSKLVLLHKECHKQIHKEVKDAKPKRPKKSDKRVE